MKIIISTKLCKFTIDVSTHEPILEIKNKIQGLLGIPAQSQTLTVWDWELIDGLDLEDYPLISDGTNINLSTTSAKMKITVKFSARKMEVEAEQSDTVGRLREKIHMMERTPMRRMALFFNGAEMEDDLRSLREYGVGGGGEVVVLMKAMGEATSRRVVVVVQTSASLMDGARIPVEVKDSSRVGEVREMLVERKLLPLDEYILIHKQRIMREDFSLRWHGVETGDVLYVFKGSVSRAGI
ncbi:polyubiquitin [Salvia hispanica]|uniref:polyubiquitin n=1 Tax=Salvia hispanica TaxID=49212 RepID=UPI00200921E5|nr:polyubiquitin [Salvia hispanica]